MLSPPTHFRYYLLFIPARIRACGSRVRVLTIFGSQLAQGLGGLVSHPDRHTPTMTLTRVSQRVTPLAVSPSARVLAGPSPTGQFRLTKSRCSCSGQRPLSCLRATRIGLLKNQSENFTRAASESLPFGASSRQARAVEPEFRRRYHSSAGTYTVPAAAPRYTPRRAPSVFGPKANWNGNSNTTALLLPQHLSTAAAPRAEYSSAAMAATKIDGTAVARKVRERIQAEIAQKKAVNPRFQPCLKIIQGACVHAGNTP